MSDDWFERALEGSESDETTATGDDERGETTAASDDDATPETVEDDDAAAKNEGSDESAVNEAAHEPALEADEFDPDSAPAGDGSTSVDAPERRTDATPARTDDSRADTDSGSASDADTDANADSNSNSDDGPLFDEGFGDALENVDVPDFGASGGSDGANAAGGGGAGLDSSGVGVHPGDPDGFDDVDFGLAGPDQPDFEDDVDSALPRIDLGIEGLDRMIQGGVPERSLMVAIGSAGTGKTTFGLQFLEHGLEQGENAVFIALEESRQRVIDSATEKGFAFDEYIAEDQLAVVDLDPIEMTNSLASIRNELPRLVAEFGAERLVLDSVSLLEMMYDDRARRRNEIYDFTRGLKEAGVTALLTSEAAEDTPYASRHGIVEYLTDAVFVLQYVRPDDFRETRLAIEIQKIRDANHSREKKPYELTDSGISVYQQANLF